MPLQSRLPIYLNQGSRQYPSSANCYEERHANMPDDEKSFALVLNKKYCTRNLMIKMQIVLKSNWNLHGVKRNSIYRVDYVFTIF